MKRISMCLGLLAMLASVAPAAGQAGLSARTFSERIEEVVKPATGRVGVAIMLLETGDSFARDGHGSYPMQSVYKLPIAMAMLARIDTGEFSLDQTVHVAPAEFVSHAQHSPLRDKHPGGVSLPLAEIIRLAVSESDGTASDVLLRLLGGAPEVARYLKDIGVTGIHVVDTEKALGRDERLQYRNWASPRESVVLLRALHQGRGLSAASRARLLRWITETPTGGRRLKALLPADTAVAHKTGSSRTVHGVTAATNDIGLITLPDGRTLAVAVYVSDSQADERARERVIAEVARAAWDAVVPPDR